MSRPERIEFERAYYHVMNLGDYKLTEIANHFGLGHYGGVGAAIHSTAKRCGLKMSTVV
jgi:hypothetical protein